MGNLVSNEPLREAFLRSGLSGCEVARRVGWTREVAGVIVGDSTRLKRTLGLRQQKVGGQGHYLRRRINYDTAVRIADALNCDYTEVGL